MTNALAYGGKESIVSVKKFSNRDCWWRVRLWEAFEWNKLNAWEHLLNRKFETYRSHCDHFGILIILAIDHFGNWLSGILTFCHFRISSFWNFDHLAFRSFDIFYYFGIRHSDYLAFWSYWHFDHFGNWSSGIFDILSF